MESLSRPPHRRKHATTNSFFFKNPYDDVFLTNGSERESLEAHEYAEIFSGFSSIPVLDLSGLGEQVGAGDSRSSKLDYSNIFGGFRNDDVAVSYEELFSGSTEKSKLRNPTDAQESGSLHSSGKPKRSSGQASDHSVGVKKQFNMSFNRSSQKNIDASNGETHIAQLQAVPGFTYFVDGTPRLQKKENGRTVNSLKREVSRTWSFSAEVETVKGKGGLSCEISDIPVKSHAANDVNLKSNFSKVPPPSSCPSNISGNKDRKPSRASDFVAKKDGSEKIAGEFSPPYFGEGFDENSVAAASAAALKRAIDQAQESIRLAKMIMDRKKEGYQKGSKCRPKGRLKVSDKEKVDCDSYGSKKNNSEEKYEELNPTFTLCSGIDGKFTPSVSHNATSIYAANIEVERIWENVTASKEHGPDFYGGGKLFSSKGSQRESLDEKVELENTGKIVEADETQSEGAGFPVFVASECKTANLVCNKNSLLPSTSKFASHLVGVETGEDNLEQIEVAVDHKKGPEVVAELVESPLDASQRMQEMKRNMEEPRQWQAENKVERVLNTSQGTREQEKVLGESGKILRIREEAEVSEKRENDMDDMGKQELEEMLDLEHFTVLRSALGNFLNESCNLGENETLGQVETERKADIVSERKENGLIGVTYDDEAIIWFESEEQLKEALEEEISLTEPGVFPEVGQVENGFNETLDLEIDNRAHNRDEPILELEQNKIEWRRMNTSSCGVPETIEMGAKSCAQAVFYDSVEINFALGGAGRVEENSNNCQYKEDAYEKHIDEAVNVGASSASTIFSEAQTNDASTIINETPEPCSVDLDNKSDGYQRVAGNYNENATVSEVVETLYAVDKDKEVEHLFHLEHDNEIPGTETIRRVASEEIFAESKLHIDFDSLSSDGNLGNAWVMGAYPEEEQPEEEVHASNRTAEFDLSDVRQVLEQTSESDEGSGSTTSNANINGFSAHEPEDCVENANDMIPNNEELKDELHLVSIERKFAKEQSEPKEMEKPMETERSVERGLNTEYNNENLIGNSIMEEKDAKGDPKNSAAKNDYEQRIEAIKRGREREKDRIVVERAIREARERAFAEARGRAERAAVERAAAEARQREMSEAWEKLEKSSHVKQTVDKVSTGSRLRAERAAVERATAEARGRALEKAMSQKTTYTEGKTTERFSGSSRNNGLKHSFSSSDLENGIESAQRRKARLERHQRIMERAAKALAEKNMRDLLAQKEQAERNRLAESLDADIKRWATGKEGNMRALLSTLQYILGSDSGWQPIPLTEIVTTAAVKKAYRKATLYVHPDKLQQRGASIQQKYICEKVFDLLKAAWNKFNSDER